MTCQTLKTRKLAMLIQYASLPHEAGKSYAWTEAKRAQEEAPELFAGIKLVVLPYNPRVSAAAAEQLRLARHLRDHLLTNRNNYVSLARLVEEHQISVSHLQRLFRQVYGMPVYHYIREYRLEQAAVELLSSRKHIVEIAMDAGYDSASKFSAAFKARYGVTPSAYRCAAGNETKWAIQTKTE